MVIRHPAHKIVSNNLTSNYTSLENLLGVHSPSSFHITGSFPDYFILCLSKWVFDGKMAKEFPTILGDLATASFVIRLHQNMLFMK